MPYSYVDTPTDGSTNVFPVPFEYLAKGHVKTYVNGAEVPRVFQSDGTVRLSVEAASLAGKTVRVQRRTPIGAAIVEFPKGALDTRDLNALGDQGIFLAQEAADDSAVRYVDVLSALGALTSRVEELAALTGMNASVLYQAADPLPSQLPRGTLRVVYNTTESRAGLWFNNNGTMVDLLRLVPASS